MTESPLLFGKYQLVKLLARGGMAEVFLARSLGAAGFEKEVVLKRILPELAQNRRFVEMFLSEARLAVALSQANIVQVFDLGREEDSYFIAMEWVHGVDFAKALKVCRKRQVRPPLELSVFIAGEVARALDYAHRRMDANGRLLGIVHRDIAPQNVLLSFEGEVKVTDFGIAKASTTIEEQGAVRGRLSYMAPEQAAAGEVDGRADLYALGMVLFEALAGDNPFAGRDPVATLRCVVAGDRPRLRDVVPEVPPELADIVETALQRDPAARQPTAARLHEDLSSFLYRTGRRVGARDLAAWLETLRGRPSRDADASDAPEHPSQLPPGVAPRSSSAPGGVSPESLGLERRDVTLLALEVTVARRPEAAAEVLGSLVERACRLGAHVLEQEASHAAVVFGAREPDGQDPEAAAGCALLLAATARRLEGVEVGMGLHAARILVDGEGLPLDEDHLDASLAAAGELARSAPGRILASEPAGRLLADDFELWPREDAGALELAGAREAHGAHRRRVVGRKEQFATVATLLTDVAVRGAQALTLVGDAGVGKTRLAEEIRYRLQRRNQPASWFGATCRPHERHVPLAAVHAMLRTILGIDATDPDPVQREKAQRVREMGLAAEEMLAVGVVLGVLAGRAEAVAATAPTLGSALGKIVARLAREQVTLLLWDACEHMDEVPLGLVDTLVRSSGPARLLLLATCRPGYPLPWSDAPTHGALRLGPLSRSELPALIALRLGLSATGRLPAALVEDLWLRSLGNPRYLEEYLKVLVAHGMVQVSGDLVTLRSEAAVVEIPRSLRGLVASRLARLAPDQRWTLRVASALGARFQRDQLIQASGQEQEDVARTLSTLVERGLLVGTGHREYGFAHDLFRSVLQAGLPAGERRRIGEMLAGGR